MEATINYSQEEIARMEIRGFVNEELQDVNNNKLLDFNTTSSNWKKGIAPMNDYRITLTGRAKYDIIDIGDYITYTLLEPDTSRNFIKGLRNSISHLKSFPYKFPLVQDNTLQNQGIRCMPYKIITYSMK